MELSVIIPVYNVKEYITDCVKSAIGIECTKEILLVDDGSNDGSELICNELAEIYNEVKTYHKTNEGLSSARNFGIQNSRGKYILFLDSDDFLETKEMTKIVESFKFDINVTMGLFNNYYGSGEISHELCGVFSKESKLYDIDSFVNNIPSDGKTCILTAWRFIVKKEFIIKHDLFFKNGIYHEDEEWVFRMLVKLDDIYVCNSYFYNYRRNREGSITNNSNLKHVVDRIFIMNEILKNNCVDNDIKNRFMIERVGQMYLSNLFDLYLIKDTKYESQVLNEMRNKKIFFYKFNGDRSFKLTMLKIIVFIIGIKKTSQILDVIKREEHYG